VIKRLFKKKKDRATAAQRAWFTRVTRPQKKQKRQVIHYPSLFPVLDALDEQDYF
jgi:hypothetical protein